MKDVYKNPIKFVKRAYIVITYRIVRLFDAFTTCASAEPVSRACTALG